MAVDRAKVRVPDRLLPVFAPARGAVRYRAAWGGRGSGKSYSFALMALTYGWAERLRILATREYQESIKQSFHAECARVIADHPWLAQHYTVGESFIRGANGTEWVFAGLRRNISSLQSLAAVDLCIVEEAESIPEDSWQKLIPTIRADRSEIWVIWNPATENSPVDRRLRKSPPVESVVAELHYWDNPWFPEVLERERQHDQKLLDQNAYAHIWEGAYLTNSVAQVLHGKVRVDEFTPCSTWSGPYHGADWGFAQDPTAAVRCWVHADTLYVEMEGGKVGLELDQTSAFLRTKLPGVERHIIRADSARPETISYLQRHGLPNIQAVRKWPGSVEDGITHLRSYREIVVHPRCSETIRETRLYSYKTDRLTGDVLPDVVDAHNHYIDSIRYALAPLIQQRHVGGGGIKVRGL